MCSCREHQLCSRWRVLEQSSLIFERKIFSVPFFLPPSLSFEPTKTKKMFIFFSTIETISRGPTEGEKKQFDFRKSTMISPKKHSYPFFDQWRKKTLDLSITFHFNSLMTQVTHGDEWKRERERGRGIESEREGRRTSAHSLSTVSVLSLPSWLIDQRRKETKMNRIFYAICLCQWISIRTSKSKKPNSQSTNRRLSPLQVLMKSIGKNRTDFCRESFPVENSTNSRVKRWKQREKWVCRPVPLKIFRANL